MTAVLGGWQARLSTVANLFLFLSATMRCGEQWRRDRQPFDSIQDGHRQLSRNRHAPWYARDSAE
jgi:hypothetical protein